MFPNCTGVSHHVAALDRDTAAIIIRPIVVELDVALEPKQFTYVVQSSACAYTLLSDCCAASQKAETRGAGAQGPGRKKLFLATAVNGSRMRGDGERQK